MFNVHPVLKIFNDRDDNPEIALPYKNFIKYGYILVQQKLVQLLVIVCQKDYRYIQAGIFD